MPRPSSSSPIMGANALGAELVRGALKALKDSEQLGHHPLTHLKSVQTSQRLGGHFDTPTGRGAALRQVLLQALEQLRPATGPPNFHEPTWCAYLVLTEQYLKGRRPEDVAERLGLSRRTYFREQTRALDELARVLQAWEAQPTFLSHFAHHHPIPFLAPPLPTSALVGREKLLGAIKGGLLACPPHLVSVSGIARRRQNGHCAGVGV